MMKFGSQVEFIFLSEYGKQKQVVLVLGKKILDQDRLSDYEVYERLSPDLRKISIDMLGKNGIIFAARNLLYRYPNARNIEMREKENKAVIVLAFLAFLLAIIALPLFVILGMRGKFILKQLYRNCQGDAYKNFVSKYTIVGIVLYAVVIIMIIIDKIFKLYTLTGPAFDFLAWGGIVYFVVSWILAKKVFSNNGELSSLKLFSKKNTSTRKNNQKPSTSSRERAETRNNDANPATAEKYAPMYEKTVTIADPNGHNTVSRQKSEPQRSQSNLGTEADQPAIHRTIVSVNDKQFADVHSRRNPPEGKYSGKYSNSSGGVSTTTSRGKRSKGRYAKPARRNSQKIILIIIILCIVLILAGLGYVFLSKAPRKETTVTTLPESASTHFETVPQQATNEATEIADDTFVQEKRLSMNEYVGYWRIIGNQDKELTIHSGDSNTVHFSLWYAAKGQITDASAQLQDNVAPFSLAIDGTVIKGILTFNQNSITVQITHSTYNAIPVEIMEFTELYMVSQAYIEETEVATETEETSISPYTLKINDNYHGIYSRPSYESSYVEDIPTGKYTIVEEQYDQRGNLWGKLKSDAGWICLTGINESKPTAGYLLPFSSVRLLTEEDLSSLTSKELRIARNEIFARHGRLFEDKGLQDYFNKKAWYFGHIESSDFSESMLSDVELANVDFIRSHQ